MTTEAMARTLRDDEVLDLGMTPYVNNGQLESPLDNAAVEALLVSGRLPQADKAGRQIISFTQYRRMRKKVDLSKYSMWMEIPGARGAVTRQASKYLKYYREGYEAVGAPEEFRHSIDELVNVVGMQVQAAEAAVAARKSHKRVAVPVAVAAQGDSDVTFYWCKDKYPECRRVFDNPTGLKFHWRQEHGEAPIGKRKAKAKE